MRTEDFECATGFCRWRTGGALNGALVRQCGSHNTYGVAPWHSGAPGRALRIPGSAHLRTSAHRTQIESGGA